MPLLQWIENLDRALVVLINNDTDRAWLDPVMTLLRHPYTWIPLYVYMLYLAIRKLEWRAWLFTGCTLLTFAITDSLSAAVMKPFFGRLRPCQDPDLGPLLRDLIDCGGMYGLPSSHAANHFGLAAFWFIAILAITGKKWHWLWIWAAIIGYAQIYVGKHYPSDIVVGGVVGLITGTGAGWLFRRLWPVTQRYTLVYNPPASLR
ncbi:MAG: phosphatase PAP2 family protein [Candidatus Pseudobacter hemicellulosilyticus]|uniref:Phosphatase PAP2 family protein n=1 Tax=Candidatus Pseudobacter hemicellulosilyticus TaxID=3121375 RepID=A0AAJ6BH08_9BACT|nr:MAG: phosphatase PAP2 family protein [Pseudobacter sp.]